MKTLYLDCAYGLSGDMFLAALYDAGVSFAPFEKIIADAGLAVSIKAQVQTRQSIKGTAIDIEFPEAQPLRHLQDILSILERLNISEQVRGRSARAFHRLAEVEAAVHGVAVETIHFHEVGAVDTIVDVVGAFWALEALGVKEVVSSSLPWFKGTVVCEHGVLALPAPAVLELLKGKSVHATDFEGEMVTPTGALLIDQLVTRFANGADGVLELAGLGYGQRDTGGGLRACLFSTNSSDGQGSNSAPSVDEVYVLESHIDHLTGEELGSCFDIFMDEGALDVFFTAGIMKKNRPAGSLKVLCKPEDLDRMQQLFFVHTHTLGIRRQKTERVLLPRKEERTETPFGEMDGKTYVIDGVEISKPEYEELVKFSKKTGRSLPELRYMLFNDSSE